MNHHNSLGAIYIETKYDDPKELERILVELDATVPEDYCLLKVDGNDLPDLSVCLNAAIKAATHADVDYITWTHQDMHYDDLNWYQTLRNTLEAYPEILKICASNSRDAIGEFRIGQEQSWLMRTLDFEKYPFLFFDDRFKGIGGYEDWYQSYKILSSGYLVCITPFATVHHKGAESRSKHDTTSEQWFNHDLYCQLVGSTTAVEPHTSSVFCSALTEDSKQERLSAISPAVRLAAKLL